MKEKMNTICYTCGENVISTVDYEQMNRDEEARQEIRVVIMAKRHRSASQSYLQRSETPLMIR